MHPNLVPQDSGSAPNGAPARAQALAGAAGAGPARIVIVGGGFAGARCALELRRRLKPREADLVLFNRENHMVFHPLLAEVVGSSLNPDAIVVPLRQMLPGVECRTEDVVRVDLGASEIEYEAHDGNLRRLPYDQVVLACGNRVNLGLVPGMADHAFPLKTIGDAIALRSHVMQQLEKAEVCGDPARRRWYLTFIIVGGGFSGVEAAGEIHDLALGTRRFFRNIRREDITVMLIHSRDEILPEIGTELRRFARARMERAGIRLILQARVTVATPDGVTLEDGRSFDGATVVCTIGSAMSPVVQRLDAPKEKDRVRTDPDMRVAGCANAWAIGDCACVRNAHDGQAAPPTGQFAERQGRQAARNLVRVLRGEPTRPFSFKPLGQLCSIGGHTAVAELLGWRLSGFAAWFVWRGVYLFKLPTWSRRVKVGFDWAWQLVFARDLSHLKADLTQRVSGAHYDTGDVIFRQGDAASNFYIIENGEVEVLRERPDVPPAVRAVLGPGAFFGERALLTNETRNATVRARTPVDVVVVGRSVFGQLSTALAPLRSLLAEAMRRRAVDVWERLPGAEAALDRLSLNAVVQPAPRPWLAGSATFWQLLQAFDAEGLEFCYVSDDGERLDGLVTRSDLFRALEEGAGRDTPVREFMRRDPVTVTLQDPVPVVARAMRDRQLKWIPVLTDAQSRRITGCVRAQTLIAAVWRTVPAADPEETGGEVPQA
jgi:NADH dehydrogenase